MKNLIRQTLERDFDLPQYTDFVKNLFNEIQIQPQEIKVPDSSKEFIKKITFLSDFSDTQKRTIDVYAVELAGGTKVERARSFQRNLISKLLKDNTKDAGLVAFYSKENPDWRLSFIKLDYKLTDKGVKVEVGTPPKRYSFLVGEAEPSHTAQKQLLPILEDHKHNPLLSDIEEAFSVERVTKEFYERYRKLFEDLSKDLNKNKAFQIIAGKENIDIDNFAKKLLGQIVFLYFLQKKGWLGVPQDKTWGQGDKFFLRTLFNKAKVGKKDFYDHYLEPLFYDTLNNPRRDEVDPAYSRYFDCKIPFLNGGLFEPDYDWKNTIVYLGNEIFEEIIDTFDLYNFTVKEDEPLEKEVAVDPEMLGKVFENLLPENMRKGQGAYYTPREIVHYMCQESLINHLSTETKIDAERIRKLVAFKDEDLVNGNGSRKKALGFSDDEAQSLDRALANIKVCDPACGSGAFLVGMLNEIVSARRILEPRSEYKLKKETIQECIYGVDIDPGAVDIAKLRLWLSLVVDFELRDIEPLPNLDYKIMCGNSLLEELIVGDESIKLFDERLLNLKELKSNPLQDARQGELKKQLQEKQKELRDLYNANKLSMAKKKELDGQILAISKELNPKTKKVKTEAYHPVFFADQADEYFKRLRELHKQFFTEYDPIKKKERRKQIEEIELEFIRSSIKEKVDEFDSKIKNLNMQDSGDRKKQAELMKKKLEYSAIPEQIRNSKARPYFLWKLNFFEVFQEKGGFDVVIANPPYVRADSSDFKDQRDAIMQSGRYETLYEKWDLFVPFIEHGLKLLSNLGNLSYITSNSLLTSKFAFRLLEYIQHNYAVQFIDYFGDETKVFEAGVVPVVFGVSKQAVFPSVRKTIHHGKFNDVVQYEIIPLIDFKSLGKDAFRLSSNSFKLKIKTILLGDICYLSYGLRPNSDERYWQGEFTRNDLISEKKDATHPMPYVEGKNISHYRINKVLYLEWGTDRVPKKLVRPTFPDLYNRPKILCGIMTGGTFDDANIICNHSIVVMVRFAELQSINNKSISGSLRKFNSIPRPELEAISIGFDLKYILAILNSKFANRLLNSIRRHRLENYFYPDDFRKLPIADISVKHQKPFVEIVGKILTIIKSADYLENPAKQAKVKEYERQIDQMVYDLYGLTKKEIEIVENYGR